MKKLLILLLTSILTAQTYNYSDWIKEYGTVQHTFEIGDTLTFKVSGLVCSFCAHGLNKGIGKLNYTYNNTLIKSCLRKQNYSLMVYDNIMWYVSSSKQTINISTIIIQYRIS